MMWNLWWQTWESSYNKTMKSHKNTGMSTGILIDLHRENTQKNGTFRHEGKEINQLLFTLHQPEDNCFTGMPALEECHHRAKGIRRADYPSHTRTGRMSLQMIRWKTRASKRFNALFALHEASATEEAGLQQALKTPSGPDGKNIRCKGTSEILLKRREWKQGMRTQGSGPDLTETERDRARKSGSKACPCFEVKRESFWALPQTSHKFLRILSFYC